MHDLDGRKRFGTMMAGAALAADALRAALAAAALLALPLVAMQFTSEVAWTGPDFAVAAVLLTGACLACLAMARLAARRPRPWRRIAAWAGLALACASIWAELAVGMFLGLGS